MPFPFFLLFTNIFIFVHFGLHLSMSFCFQVWFSFFRFRFRLVAPSVSSSSGPSASPSATASGPTSASTEARVSDLRKLWKQSASVRHFMRAFCARSRPTSRSRLSAAATLLSLSFLPSWPC